MSKGVTTSEGYHLQKSGDRVSTLLSRHYVVPTLASPPNENTLAWNDDSYIVNFRIGEFARVATDNGYLFYRLDDITENKASWQELTSEDLSNYYTKDEINQLLSGLDPDIPQPDWNARKEEEGFIANRTHYYKTITRIGTYQLASLNAGDILVSDLTDDAVYIIQKDTVSNISNIEELIPIEGNRVAIPVDGPTIYAVVTKDDDGKLNLVLENNYGISNYIKIEKAYIGKQLCERFLPEQIARTKDIESVRNSIIGEDGYIYSNGEKVDMRFTRSLLPVGTSIPANSNLNTINYLKIGKYYCSLNVDAETITYCPVKVAFSMEVFNPLGTNVDDETTRDYTYRLRVITQYDSGTQYIQFCKTSGTAGKWTYGDWYAAPRTKATLNSNKKGSTMTLGSGTQGVYVSSTGVLTKMTYTLGKSVPKDAVFTDTNTKVTSVGNHYTPIEDEDSALETTDEVMIGLKMDAAGHVVGIKSSPDFAKKSYVDDKFSNVSGGIKFKGVVTELPWEGYILEFYDQPWDKEERKTQLQGYEVGDLIIVASKEDDMGDSLPDSTEEPAVEYILISEYESQYNNGDNNIRYRWEDLGDCSVSDRKIVALEQKHDSQIETKQDILVSGTNIKTINGQSLLGPGNITIESGDSAASNIYFTDFTVETLFNAIDFALANPGKYKSFDASAELLHAFYEGKIILIPYDNTSSGNGYVCAIEALNDGDTDSFLTIIREDSLIRICLSNEDLEHDSIYISDSELSIKKIGEGSPEAYITDFLMSDIEIAIENAMENVGDNFSVDADGTKLWEAIQRHKQIIIPYSNYADIGGYYIAASAYHNGIGHINLSIFAGHYTLNLRINKDYLLTNNKLNFNADGSVEQSIDWRFSYMTNEEATISDESRPETLVKRDSNGGIEVTTIDANFFRDTRGNTWTTPTASSEILTDADYVFQEQLKSGQNIKTINNQSLLGSGNINIEGGNAVYITPFSVDDLFTGIDFALANPDSFYLLDASPDLIYALREGKIILIPYRQDPGYLSAIRAKNDGETTYLTIPRGTTLIKLDIDDEDLYHDVIYLTANKISIEKISVSAEPDTIVKRSDSGGVNATAWHDDTGTTWVTPTSSQDTKEGADYILQEYISDLDAIREGASLGATALQSIPAEYATEIYVNNAILAAITTTLNTPV